MPRGVYERTSGKKRKPPKRSNEPLEIVDVVPVDTGPSRASMKAEIEHLTEDRAKLRAEVHRLEQLVIQMAEKLL